MLYDFDESERQMLLLAIGRLAVERPGFDHMLGQMADKLQPQHVSEAFTPGRQMFETFKRFKKEEHSGHTHTNQP